MQTSSVIYCFQESDAEKSDNELVVDVSNDVSCVCDCFVECVFFVRSA